MTRLPKQAGIARAAPSTGPATYAAVHWEADTREVLQSWPKPIRIDFGAALHEMQEGRPATLNVRPMQSVGAGVFELKTDDEASWYRLMYLARIEGVIYVLDCFKKDSRKTEKKDIARSVARYKQVKQRLMEERAHAKDTKPADPRDDRKRTRRTGPDAG